MPAWWRRLLSRRLWSAAVAFLLAFFVGAPFNFLDPHWFRFTVLPLFGVGKSGNIWKDWGPMGGGPFGESMGGRMAHWATVIFGGRALGVVLASAACLGLVWLVVRHRRQDIVLLACALTFWVLPTMLWSTYEPWLLNGLYPFLCLSAAVLACEGLAALARFRISGFDRQSAISNPSRRVGVAIATVVGLLALQSAIGVVRLNRLLSLPDTRTLACRWVEANLPPGSAVLLDGHGPKLSACPESLEGALARARELEGKTPFTHHITRYYEYRMRAARNPSYYVHEINHIWWRQNSSTDGLVALERPEDTDVGNPVRLWGVKPLAEYLRNGCQYAVLCSADYAKFLSARGRERFPKTSQFYEDVFSQGQLLHEEAARPGQSRGPTVRVYRLPGNTERGSRKAE